MNFRRWNYNCAFHYYYKRIGTIYKINVESLLLAFFVINTTFCHNKL
jgi:hypothetical protein